MEGSPRLLLLLYLQFCLQAVSEAFVGTTPTIRSHIRPLSCTSLQSFVTDDDITITHQRNEHPSLARRTLLSLLLSSSIVLTSTAVSPQSAQATSAVEGIRQSASSIPGYGPSNIYYPPYLLGKWRATQVIVKSEEDSLLASWDKAEFPLTLFYNVRFIAIDGTDQVVADRLYNQESYYKALRAKAAEISSASTSTMIPPPLQRVEWNPSNPNILTQLYTDGSSREVKVTKRASDMVENDNGTVLISSSEYRRITTVSSGSGDAGSRPNPVGGIPTLNASRVLTKWNIINSDLMEGMELMYGEAILGGGGDPMSSAALGGKGSGTGKAGPQVISKSMIRLQRIKQDKGTGMDVTS